VVCDTTVEPSQSSKMVVAHSDPETTRLSAPDEPLWNADGGHSSETLDGVRLLKRDQRIWDG